jgi:hypothetical protein
MSIKLCIEIEVEVDYDYSPAEPMVQYPNEDAYPGCAASIGITGVMYNGAEMPGLTQLDETYLTEQVENHIESMNEDRA